MASVYDGLAPGYSLAHVRHPHHHLGLGGWAHTGQKDWTRPTSTTHHGQTSSPGNWNKNKTIRRRVRDLFGLTPQHTGQTSPPTDQSCPTNQIVDASTWKCQPVCPDDSRPCGGKCIGYSGAPFATMGSPCAAPGTITIGGTTLPKWVVWAAAGIAVGVVALLAWRAFGPKGAAATARAASYYGIW